MLVSDAFVVSLFNLLFGLVCLLFAIVGFLGLLLCCVVC